MAIIDDVKTLINVSDDADQEKLDEMLGVLIRHSSSQLLALLNPGVEEVPEALEYIVTEVTVSRYNRIGNEGMERFEQDGESITYNADDMAPYMSAIDAWNTAQDPAAKGRVRFI